MKRQPKLPPWSRHHEPWCAIFRGKSCDCDDDGGPVSPRAGRSVAVMRQCLSARRKRNRLDHARADA